MGRRIHSAVLDGWVDPEDAFLALYGGDAYAFWFDSGCDARAGVSYMGASANGRTVIASVFNGTVTHSIDGFTPRVDVTEETIFDFLRRQLLEAAVSGAETDSLEADPCGSDPFGSDPVEPAFGLGWVGWLGYELGAQTTGLTMHSSAVPDAGLIFIDRMLRFDHQAQCVTLLMLHESDSVPGKAQLAVEGWRKQIEASLDEHRPVDFCSAWSAPLDRQAPIVSWRHDDSQYLQAIDACQAAIVRGDAYQLCLTNEVRIEGRFDPLRTFLHLRRLSPTHHGGLLRFGELSLVSASPEQFLRVSRNGCVQTKPIKGTRPRGTTAQHDAELRHELETSDKERAENLMIVDLMRNDLTRIAQPGSVAVPSLLAIESYAQVHQLVSTVRARLADGLSPIDALEMAFPAGSMTGAPKLSAMHILQQLEAGPRGAYSGAFGYIGLDGQVDLAMSIRSILIGPDSASIGAGGGITALSVPEEELAEVKIKAAALLRVLGVDQPGFLSRPVETSDVAGAVGA